MHPPSLQHVVGQNVRRLREEHSIRQDELARCARALGLKWSASRVGELENGRLGLSASAFVILAAALAKLTASPVTLGSLLAGTGGVAVGELWVLDNPTIQAIFEGDPVRDSAEWEYSRWEGEPVVFPLQPNGGLGPVLDEIDLAAQRILEKERRLRPADFAGDLATVRAARSLGMVPADVAQIATDLFGRSLSDERDRRAGPEANAQRRGSVTRELMRAIEEEWLSRDHG